MPCFRVLGVGNINFDVIKGVCTYFDNHLCKERDKGNHKIVIYYFNYLRDIFGDMVAYSHEIRLFMEMCLEGYLCELADKGYTVHKHFDKGYVEIEWEKNNGDCT